MVDAIAFRPHPWHGLDPGPKFPETVISYIELVPSDGVKYEVDKHSGYLKVDRPQRFSSYCPTLYGFVPRTLCASQVAGVPLAGSPVVDRGDGDPLDICVLTDRHVSRGDILLEARPIGGLRMVESGEADDKIIAVLQNDNVWGHARDISDLPSILIERLRHYFATYKMIPGQEPGLTVDRTYDREHALRVVEAAMQDYFVEYGD